jgi:hypothetical protein
VRCSPRPRSGSSGYIRPWGSSSGPSRSCSCTSCRCRCQGINTRSPPYSPSPSDTPGNIVFAGFADPVIFLFLGAFVLAKVMITHGLDRRFSFLVLSLHGVERSTYGVIIAFGAIAVSTSIPVMAGLILA